MNIKQFIKHIINNFKIDREYFHDRQDYKRWNYNNPRVKTIAAIDSKILRQTHIIEKGMSLSKPRKGFGQEKINYLFQMMQYYINLGYDTNRIPFQNALSVLGQYVEFQKEIGYSNIELNNKLNEYKQYIIPGIASGINHGSHEEMRRLARAQFPEFFYSRHSMRQFSDKQIDVNDVIKAVELAKKAPSACNRQACKIYFYTDPKINKQIGELIDGNKGFDNEVQHYLVLTSDISAFYDSFERNQLYIESGIFAMALVESLHYYGIGSCILQNGEYYKRNKKYKKICGNIPDNEKIALFIAIGYYKEEFNFAISNRKNVEDYLKIK